MRDPPKCSFFSQLAPPQTHSVAEDGLEFLMLLPLPLQHRYYKHTFLGGLSASNQVLTLSRQALPVTDKTTNPRSRIRRILVCQNSFFDELVQQWMTST